MDNQIISSFSVSVFGNLKNYSDEISIARCRIFYKGKNRNGTFITDEFAEKLMSTIPYTPIKGIYDDDNKDYEDHGEKRNEGRIYGVVPQEPNFQWEDHLDEDGITRTYACVDVLLYTSLYEEAQKISGKSQSMELAPKSIKGSWKIVDGQKYYVYEDAHFLGLQILGDDVDPCFQGAAFFSLYQIVKDMFNKLDYKKNKQGGTYNMPIVNYKISDDFKRRKMWCMLNDTYNEENSWEVKFDILDIYDEYAVVHDYTENNYKRVYYVKDDEQDTISLTKMELCFIEDVSEEEHRALIALRALNNGSFAKVDEIFSNIDSLNEKISENDSKIIELTTSLSTLNTDKENADNQINELKEQLSTITSQYSTAQENIVALNSQINELATYKKNKEDSEKIAIISSYSNQLNEDIRNNYLENLDKYDNESLDMALTYEVKKANPGLFSLPQTGVIRIPKQDQQVSGIEYILDKYEKH